MMLKKYMQPTEEGTASIAQEETPHITVSSAEAAVPAETAEPHEESAASEAVSAPGSPDVPDDSVIGKYLADHQITLLEKHFPETESELSEISYLLDGIAEHIDAADALFHTLRKAIAETDGRFNYTPNGLSTEQLESVKKVVKLLKLCGVFSELRVLGSYSGTISTAARVRRFIAGTWLELYGQQHGIEVITEKAKQLGLPYEILCNVQVIDQTETQHEIDLMFSIGDHVFAIEMKSGLNFMDYDRYRLLAEYLHLIPDRFMLVNSTLLDKSATRCITYFYRYYICNSADYMSTLSEMIDKAFNC